MTKLLLLLLTACTSCYVQSYPLTPNVAKASTYRILAQKGRNTVQGTTWVVSDGWLVTAGHMCVGADVMAVMDESIMRSVAWSSWEMSEDETADLCLVRWSGAHRGLILADHEPPRATPDGFVGYPGGFYESRHGTYQGDWQSSTHCDHGASGSAMYTSAGVYGVVVEMMGVDDHCAMTGLKELKRFLNENHVRYLTTPDDVGDSIPDLHPHLGGA